MELAWQKGCLLGKNNCGITALDITDTLGSMFKSEALSW